MLRIALKIRRAFATGGVRRLLQLAADRFRRNGCISPNSPSELNVRYGIDTSGNVDQIDLDTHSHATWIHASPYQASSDRLLAKLVAACDIDPQKYAFVDLGCGKGRMVFHAADVGFARAIGIEFSRELTRTAEANAALFRRRATTSAQIELHHADASTYELPDGPLVLYLYNPFGTPVMEQVVTRARRQRRSADEPLWIWYHNPKCADCWDTAGFHRAMELPELYTIVWKADDA